MAGPCLQLLLPKALNDGPVAHLNVVIAAIASEHSGDDFWVDNTRAIGGSYRGEGRPFIVGLSPPDDDLGPKVEQRFSIRIVSAITLCAMCNAPEDHRILGELMAYLARGLGGIIDFGGRLPLPGSGGDADPSGATCGRLEGVPYETVMGQVAVAHFGDADFLQWWLGSPNYRLVK